MAILELEQSGGIAVVELATPPVNALEACVLEELTDLFTRFASDSSVRAAVITGHGRSFSAGLNLKVVPDLDLMGQRRLIAALNDCYGTLYSWPKPLVAAVSGRATRRSRPWPWYWSYFRSERRAALPLHLRLQ